MGDPDHLRPAGRFATSLGLCSLAVLSALATLVAWATVPVIVDGSSPRVITSGSMQPLIRVGDVVVTEPISVDGFLAPPSIITFRDPSHDPSTNRVITHRVVTVEGGSYVTRGDANRNVDSDRVPPSDVVGVAKVVVPFVGLPRVWLGEGRLALLATLVALLATLCWASVRGLGDGDPDQPAPRVRGRGDRPRHRRSRPTRRARRARRSAGPVSLSLLAVMALTAPSSAAFSATTTNSGNSLATAQLAAPAVQPPLIVACIVTISWTASPAPANAYEYRVATGSPPTGAWTTTILTSAVTLSLGALFAGTMYYEVRSKINTTNWVSATSSGSRAVGIGCT